MPGLRQSDTTHKIIWRGHSHTSLLRNRDPSLLSISGRERSSWHIYFKGKSNYYKYILDTHNKNRQNLACVVVKQVANNTASGSLFWHEKKKKTASWVSPLALVISMLLLVTQQLATRVHPCMQLLKPYIYHSINQSLRLTVKRAVHSFDLHIQSVANTYFHLNMAEQTALFYILIQKECKQWLSIPSRQVDYVEGFYFSIPLCYFNIRFVCWKNVSIVTNVKFHGSPLSADCPGAVCSGEWKVFPGGWWIPTRLSTFLIWKYIMVSCYKGSLYQCGWCTHNPCSSLLEN